MSALVAAGFLYFLFRGLAALFADREVYGCTLCSLGVVWRGRWLHADGRLEALTEPRLDTTHPAIPARFDRGPWDYR
jgi:hypothetical protein